MKQGLRKEEQATTIKEMMAKLEKRRKVEMERYAQYYNIHHPYDRENYNLIVDTSAITAEEAADKIIAFVEKKVKLIKKS